MADLEKLAKSKGIKYFLISFTDLFGGQRSKLVKLVPASAINAMAKGGGGLCRLRTWLDMTPADSTLFVLPDPDSLIQLPWKKEVGWFAGNPVMDGKEVAHAPRNPAAQNDRKGRGQGLPDEDRGGMRIFPG